MTTARAPDPGETVAKQPTFEVLTEGRLDVAGNVAGEITILPVGGQVGLQVFANGLVQEGCGRPAGAVDSWAGSLRMSWWLGLDGGAEHGRSRLPAGDGRW